MDALTSEQCCHTCNVGKHAIFGALSAKEQEALNAEKIPEVYQRGDVVFEEGHYPKGLFCISQGKVKVTKLGDEGRDQIVRIDKQGEVLGYRSLLADEPYSATATALEKAVICFIPSRVILGFLESNSNLAFRMMKIMAQDLKKAEERLTDFTQKPVKERLAQTLLSLMDTYGQTEEGFLDINLTRQEWANLMGTTTETAIRTLSEFNKEGLISLERKKVRLLKPGQLYNMAEL
jgi:CRP/FNR family transcriptional regulator